MNIPTYEEALHRVAMNMIGYEGDTLYNYMLHGAVDIALIYEADRPIVFNDLEAKWKELDAKWESKLVISVREED